MNASCIPRVLITGATGFVGQALCRELLARRYVVRAVVRRVDDVARLPPGCEIAQVGNVGGATDWHSILSGVDTLIHLAARVHVMQDSVADPLAEFRKVNVEGTLNLACQAAAARVRRFIFISSIKVNGESTPLGRPYTADDAPAPVDPYGVSKREAEDGLRQLAAENGMEVVIIRPPLVYGPGVKANFLNMMRWLCRGIPLPLGSIHNRRSLVALDNLVDFICVCLNHPMAANQTFLVSDWEDISTTDLLRRMAHALHVPARLVPVPQGLLEWGAKMLGREDLPQRICASLQVDISKARTLLGWQPPVTVETALRRTAEHFLSSRKSEVEIKG